MTEAELVATALATGAAPGLTGTAPGTVQDLHATLKEKLHHRLRDSYGTRVLHAYDTDPDVWHTRLLQVLTTQLTLDEDILTAARAVLRADRHRGHAIASAADS
ncbi:hypothetical protein ABZ584_35035 [Streptomyces antibioticus]|uniref:hypothetical protein n=1 Tax=Streptomyces antibioticus TaxID=1890 RepID=UPI0033D77C21